MAFCGERSAVIPATQPVQAHPAAVYRGLRRGEAMTVINTFTPCFNDIREGGHNLHYLTNKPVENTKGEGERWEALLKS